MKITLDRLAVKDALDIGRRPVSTSQTHAHGRKHGRLRCIGAVHVVADDHGVVFQRTDLGKFTSVRTDAEVHAGGETLVKAKALREAVQRGEDEVSLVLEDGKLYVQNGEARLSVPSFGEHEWPELPEAEGKFVSVGEQGFDRLLRVAVAAGDDDQRPTLKGVQFSDTHVAATDTYRLHFYAAETGFGDLAGELIPATLFLDASKEDKRTDQYALNATGSWASLFFETHRGRGGYRPLSVRYSAKTIEGTYPDWQQLVPEPDELVGQAIFPRASMVEALDAVKPVTEQDSAVPVKLLPRGGILQATGFDGSEASASFGEGYAEGDVPTEVGYNPDYLRDALDSLGCDRVRVQWKPRPSLGPAMFTGGDVTVLLMPVRLD